jgi:AcrR family transcriptional regulator
VRYWFSNKDELLEAVINDTFGPIESAVAAGAAADEQAGADLLTRMRAAFDVMKNDDRGRQIAMYEMTTHVLRDEALVPVARRQYDTYGRVATESVSA